MNVGFGWFLCIGLLVMFGMSVYTAWTTFMRDKEIIRAIKRVDEMLCAWAVNWGDDPLVIRAQLIKILENWDRRDGDRRRT